MSEVGIPQLLAIDDDPQNLELITAALASERLQVLTASDPEAGFEVFLRVRPRIVLLDLVMPNVSGMELLQRIVGIDPGVDVILITAHYSTESAVEAIQKGACDYLNKPLEVEKLREPRRKSHAGREHPSVNTTPGARASRCLSIRGNDWKKPAHVRCFREDPPSCPSF